MSLHTFDPSYARPAGQDRCVVCGQPKGHQSHRVNQAAQIEQARQKANAVRTIGAQVKRDLREGRMPLTMALYDMRADSLTIRDLLIAAPGWRAPRAEMVLESLRISPIKRCKTLTPHQRRQIANVATGRNRNAA